MNSESDMDLDQRLASKSAAIFTSFVKSMATIEPTKAALLVTGGITPFIGYGLVSELALLQQVSTAGPEAVSAYIDAMPNGAVEMLVGSLKGSLATDGLNTLGRTVVALATLPAVAAVTAKMSNVFSGLKDQVKSLQDENIKLSGWYDPKTKREQNTQQAREAGAGRGATRLEDSSVSTHERFTRALSDFNERMNTSVLDDEKPAIKYKGPTN
ncbi:hypothetical protein LCGC14_0282140 [marine sediment metagenome]|uniref:Uncharacterized protein n=1 Tax=marine sediment metagenome TaxID=412755 RepID=A0A0F9TVH8_9ZZZZ